jgi:hypothetical protein
MPEQEDWPLSVAAVPGRKLGSKVIAPLGLPDCVHAGADRFKAPPQIGAAAVHSGLVRRWRFQSDESFYGVEQPTTLGTAKITKV